MSLILSSALAANSILGTGLLFLIWSHVRNTRDPLALFIGIACFVLGGLITMVAHARSAPQDRSGLRTLLLGFCAVVFLALWWLIYRSFQYLGIA